MLVPQIFPKEEIIAAQSERLNSGYDPAHESEEKNAFLKALSVSESQLASSKQVHGNRVLIADAPMRSEGYDAVITNKKGVFACVATADCTPILVFDKKNKAVAAIHAGWRGTAAKIVSETLKAMTKSYGTRGEDCLAFIGACISYNQFEVGPEVAARFDENVKSFNLAKNKYFIDLKKANYLQLTEFGVAPENIEISTYCTVLNNARFYSYRKEHGKTGRLYSLIGLR